MTIVNTSQYLVLQTAVQIVDGAKHGISLCFEIPWCRLQALDKIAMLLYHTVILSNFNRLMAKPVYTFHQSNLPKLDLNTKRDRGIGA